MRVWRATAFAVAALVACSDLKTAPLPGDAGTSGSEANDASLETGVPSNPSDAGTPDSGEVLLDPPLDASVRPALACRPILAACPPANAPGIIEVPTEMTLEAALAVATAGDTIQFRSGSTAAAFKVPKGVSLRGCVSAVLDGDITFGGGTQNIEGLRFTKRLTFDESGTYRISRSAFDSTTAQEPGVFVTSGATMNADIDVTIDESEFRARERGLEIVGTSTAGAKGVRVNVKNSTFFRVQRPFVMRRASGSPILFASITSSTFHTFVQAVELFDLGPTVTSLSIRASLFYLGLVGVGESGEFSASGWDVSYSFVWQVNSPLLKTHPSKGAFVTDLDPSFVDDMGGDLRLAADSSVVDRIPLIAVLPPTDFQGCKRPAGEGADPGAYESQPFP